MTTSQSWILNRGRSITKSWPALMPYKMSDFVIPSGLFAVWRTSRKSSLEGRLAISGGNWSPEATHHPLSSLPLARTAQTMCWDPFSRSEGNETTTFQVPRLLFSLSWIILPTWTACIIVCRYWPIGKNRSLSGPSPLNLIIITTFTTLTPHQSNHCLGI